MRLDLNNSAENCIVIWKLDGFAVCEAILPADRVLESGNASRVIHGHTNRDDYQHTWSPPGSNNLIRVLIKVIGTF